MCLDGFLLAMGGIWACKQGRERPSGHRKGLTNVKLCLGLTTAGRIHPDAVCPNGGC